jgi:sulfhydrogenase subunit alpha
MSPQAVDMDIKVHHVTRVEGHGNIVVDVKNGEVRDCKLEIVEAPRFFESFLRGRSWREAHLITSRICGICSPGHQLTSLKATEDAMGIVPSEQTVLLRKIVCDAAFLQSHVLHVCFLAVPDLLGVPSVIPLATTHPGVVKLALKLKKLANDICDAVAGRAVHPVRMIPGGFTMVPTEQELRSIQQRCTEGLNDLKTVAEFALSVADRFPTFERPTEYISLRSEDEYALYDGQIYSSVSGATDVHNYLKMTNEYVVDYASAKRTKVSRESFAVGALARCNNNRDKFNVAGELVATMLGFKTPCHNPYMCTVAQIIESALVTQRIVQCCERLVRKGIKDEGKPDIKVKAGRGVGATEVPRGILYHDYTYDSDGIITDANCIIPTNQNTANIEYDMKKLVPEMLQAGKSQPEITMALEMLVRAYDPCISCSVHMLDVKFV